MTLFFFGIWDQSEWQSLNENIENNVWEIIAIDLRRRRNLYLESQGIWRFSQGGGHHVISLRSFACAPQVPVRHNLDFVQVNPFVFATCLQVDARSHHLQFSVGFFSGLWSWIWICQVSQGVCERTMTFEGIFWGTSEELSTMLKSRVRGMAM